MFLNHGDKQNSINLAKDVYQMVFIAKAVEAYRDICKITITESSQYYHLKFEECEYEAELTIKEFCNYVVDVSNKGDK